MISAVEDLARALHLNLSNTTICESNLLCNTFLDEYIHERRSPSCYKTYHDSICDAVAVFIAASVTVNTFKSSKEAIVNKLVSLELTDSFISLVVSRLKISLFPDIRSNQEVIERVLENFQFCSKIKHAFITDVLVELCATKVH